MNYQPWYANGLNCNTYGANEARYDDVNGSISVYANLVWEPLQPNAIGRCAFEMSLPVPAANGALIIGSGVDDYVTGLNPVYVSRSLENPDRAYITFFSGAAGLRNMNVVFHYKKA